MRALFVGIVGMLLLAVGGPAGAKWMFDAADISGPGLGPADLRISGPATEGLWNAGIDVADGMDDTRPDSIADLGLTASELGPRYVAMYRLETGTAAAEIVRQELYPYADGGPVTYTPPGQRIADGLPWGGAISAGWYRNPPAFFQYLVDQGLPRTEPMTAPPARDSASGSPAAARSTPWGLFALAVGGLVALSVAAISSWSTASRV